RIAEREDAQCQEIHPKSSTENPDLEAKGFLGRFDVALILEAEKDYRGDNQSRNKREQKECAEIVRKKIQKNHGQEWTQRGAKMVHGAVEAKCIATLLQRCRIGNQRIPGRSANAFATAISRTDSKDMPPNRGKTE